jgi:predicted RNase H-like nuclease (RuvC/YqgF family)
MSYDEIYPASFPEYLFHLRNYLEDAVSGLEERLAEIKDKADVKSRMYLPFQDEAKFIREMIGSLNQRIEGAKTSIKHLRSLFNLKREQDDLEILNYWGELENREQKKFYQSIKSETISFGNGDYLFITADDESVSLQKKRYTQIDPRKKLYNCDEDVSDE